MDAEIRQTLEGDAVFRVGRVSRVSGRRVQVRVDKEKNSSHLFYRGELVRNVSVGSYVKIAKGFSEMVGQVDGESVTEDSAASAGYGRPSDRVLRTLDISLVGFIRQGRFERGVRELPLLDNECFVLRSNEVRAIHDIGDSDRPRLQLGVLATEPTQPVWIDVDQLFGSHVGIFGNTGSGKSYTLAKLYYELLRAHANEPRFGGLSQFVLIDFNGEYVDLAESESDGRSTHIIAGPDLKHTYQLSTRSERGDKLPMSEEALRDPTFWTVLLDATERTQAPFIRRVLDRRFWREALEDDRRALGAMADVVWRATRTNTQGTDRQTATSLLRDIQESLGDNAPPELDEVIDEFHQELQYNGTTGSFYWERANGTLYSNQDPWPDFIKDKVKALDISVEKLDAISRIRMALVLQYHTEIVNGHANREHLSPLIKRLHGRIHDIRRVVSLSSEPLVVKPMTVVSLRDVNLDMRKIIPMLLCRQLYEAKKDNSPKSYLNLIIDEAHNILSTQSTRESDAWRDYRLETFEEIIKEGRKFGVFLTIASQRPHDIAETIISQLHNYFLHRLINDMDVRAIEKAVAYLDAVSFESLPILATGSCVMAGVSTQVPVIVQVAEIPEACAPNNRTMSLVDTWRDWSATTDDA
jgi:hypothetical protein